LKLTEEDFIIGEGEYSAFHNFLVVDNIQMSKFMVEEESQKYLNELKQQILENQEKAEKWDLLTSKEDPRLTNLELEQENKQLRENLQEKNMFEGSRHEVESISPLEARVNSIKNEEIVKKIRDYNTNILNHDPIIDEILATKEEAN
jgi:hypothetical protein